MPVEFQVVANNCELVGQVLDAGIAAYLAERVVKPDFQYTCMETAKASLTNWQIFLAIYVLALLPGIAGWAVLYFKREQTDRFFNWGFLSFVIPFFGPLIALIPVDEHSGSNLPWAALPKSPSKGHRHADDAN